MSEDQDYQVPVLPLVKNFSPDGKFVCESCYNNKAEVDHEEEMILGTITSMCVFKSQKHLDIHKETKKHKKNVENGIKCPHCNNIFSKEGFEEHKRQNQPILTGLKVRNKQHQFKCNNFVFNGIRFHSNDAMEQYKQTYQKYLYRRKIYQNDLRFIREREKTGRKARKRLPNGNCMEIILNNAEKNKKK